MKRVTSFLIGVLLLPLVLRAQSEPVDRTEPALETVTQESDSDYKWLFEKLFPAEIRQQFPDQSFKSFRVHLRDSDQRFPDPGLIEARNLKPRSELKGSMLYVGFFRKKYFYDVIESPKGGLILQVRVHFQNASQADLNSFSEKLRAAEQIWNENRISTDFDYEFKFTLVPTPAQAHFSVWLLDSTRGPYDQFWSRDWKATSVAHELGHMMGLGDEYETLTSKADCYRLSLMCESWTGKPLPHNYYFILRRLLN